MASEVLNTSHETARIMNGGDLDSWEENKHDPEMESNIKIDNEVIPTFEEIRTKLLPIVKTDSWLKSIKDRLLKANGTAHSVFYKPLNNASRIDVGFTVAILSDEDEYQYVLNSYLAEWHISSLTLVQIAQANFRKRLLQEEKVWHTSRTGIRYIQGLGPLTSSVILLPDVIESLGVQQGDPVACIPAGDLCMIGDSQNPSQICVMAEIALKLRETSTQPLRLLNKEWKIYEANKANDEHPFPRSGDEVKMLKRALKMQGKI